LQAADPPPAAQIPAELQVLMAGNDANLKGIQSFSAAGTMKWSNKGFLQYTDIHGGHFDSQQASLRFCKDGENWFMEKQLDHEFNPQRGQVNYNLPFGEDIVPSNDDLNPRIDQILLEKGISQATHRYLIHDHKYYSYLDEAKSLSIVAADDHVFDASSPSSWFVEGAILDGRTLTGYIQFIASLASDTSLPHQVSFNVSPSVNGVYTVTQTILYPGQSGTVHGETVLTIDSTKGYGVTSFVGKANGKINNENRYSYQNVGGSWVMTFAELRDTSGSQPSSISLVVDPQSLHVNEPIDAGMLAPQALALRKGTLVQDHTQGRMFVYEDVPLEIKAAVAYAQKDLDNIPEGIAQAQAPALLAPSARPSRLNSSSEGFLNKRGGSSILFGAAISVLAIVVGITSYLKFRRGRISRV
jgi:hypothetical protein